MSKRKVIKVKHIMTQNYICMDGMQTIREAITSMQENKVDAIIVNKRDDDDSFGILLLSDIAKLVLARDRSPERVNIYEIMSKPVLSISPEMDVRYCARLFESFGLTIAPAIEGEKILGLVGYRELVLHEFTPT